MLRPASLILLALLGASACSRDKGAVLVRWRLVDSSTGQGTAACTAASAPALSRETRACCAGVKSERRPAVRDVIVDHIRLRAQLVSDLDQIVVPDVPCPSCCFTCSPPENTTQFELSPGTYKLWIEALRCGVVVGVTPPALVRQVTAGEITNLDSIEVRVDPETDPVVCPLDGGVSHGCSAAAPAPGDGLDGGLDAGRPDGG